MSLVSEESAKLRTPEQAVRDILHLIPPVVMQEKKPLRETALDLVELLDRIWGIALSTGLHR